MSSQSSALECNISLKLGDKFLSPLDLVREVRSNERLPLTLLGGESQSTTVAFDTVRNIFANNTLGAPSTSTDGSCHLQGGFHGEVSSLSACTIDDISAVFRIHERTYVLVVKDAKFVLLPQTHNTCDFHKRSKRATSKTSKAPTLPTYYSDIDTSRRRFVELALFADNSVYKKYNSNEDTVKVRLQSIANHVNALYQVLNIHVRLVYQEVWSDGDKLEVVTSGDKTLDLFLQYRKKLLKDHPNDNAHLLTNIRFEQGVVGKAFKGTMCNYDYSGGVNVDHSDHAAMVAATLAHEMGHNFGMDHDVNYIDACICQTEHCIMAASAGRTPPSYWSSCSIKQLANSLSRGVDFCLLNSPDTVLGEAKCGNGIVEPGEACDCGAEVCPNGCCNGKTCQLIEEAQCGAGECCDLLTCKLKKRATMCRNPIGICDLPEYCNGETAECPADFFAQEGTVCPGRTDEYCYDGQCGSRDDQCKLIWGSSGRDGMKQCYDQNKNGLFQGNCGYDAHTQMFQKCLPEDIMCGRLQCDALTQRPVFGDPTTVSSAYTFVRIGERNHQCSVIKTQYIGGKKKSDPGMVNDGAVCSKDKICVSKKCTPLENVRKLTSKCNDNCHNRGVCNNMGNCHCENGYGGVACEIPGFGGSVNSNQAALSRGFSTLYMAVFLLVLFGFVFGALTYYYKKKKNIWLPTVCWDFTKKKLKLQGILVPVRKAPPPPGGAHRPMKKDSLNAMWGDGGVVTYRSSDSAVPQFHPSPPTMNITIPPTFSNPAPIAGMGYPAQAVITTSHSNVTVARAGSLRPKAPPPTLPFIPNRPRESIVNQLYNERGEELGMRAEPKELTYREYVTPPPDPDHSSTDKTKKPKIERVDSVNRPVKPPPPPPHKEKNEEAKPPVIPKKPPVAMKPPMISESDSEAAPISVKDIRAKFNQN